MTRRLVRWPAWIAIFAILWSAVAPTVAHALRQTGGPSWAALCSAAQAPTGGNGSPTAPSGHAPAHCPYCALQSLGSAPPPAAVSIRLQPAPAFETPVFAAPPAPAGGVWTFAQPRAPPTIR